MLGAGTALVAAGAARGAEATPAFPPSAAAAIDAAVRKAFDDGVCPGSVVAVSGPGRMSFAKAYGTGNLETRSPVTLQSVFRLGSLTKQFTAAAIVKLASEGRLHLDEDAQTRLPSLKSLKPFTLRELMNHTAGLSDHGDTAPPSGGGPKSSTSLAQEIASQAKPFDFAPGTAWLYSNANYIILGAVLEAVTGRPLAQALAEVIFKPLGLASLAIDGAGDVVTGRVNGYSPAASGRGFTNAEFIEIGETGGAGAMRGTVSDLIGWHEALFSGRLFAPRWVEEMLTPGRLRDGRLSGAARFSAADATYGDTQYGLGLLLPPPTRNGRSALHYGYVNGFSACLETLIDRKVTTAVLCNGDAGPNMPFRTIRRAVNDSLATV